MLEINPDKIKEILEIPASEADKYLQLGWIEVDTYQFEGQNYIVLAWISDAEIVKP